MEKKKNEPKPPQGQPEIELTHQQQSQLDETPFLKQEIEKLKDDLEEANKKIEQQRKEKQKYMRAAYENESVVEQAKQQYE